MTDPEGLSGHGPHLVWLYILTPPTKK